MDNKKEALYQTILNLKTINDCDIFFADLCTNKEIEQFSERLEAARLLSKGETYNEVIEHSKISSATLSRVSRALKYGKGYKKFLNKE